MDATFIKARIEAAKALVIAYEDALTALAGENAVKEYMLDTGQTRTRVTREDYDKIQQLLDGAYNRLATLEARLYGSASVVRPGW